MRAIFISYRRNDSEGEAGRLFDDLARHFGGDSVFMDVAAIEPGRDFRKSIDESVATCGVLLAIISNNWIDAKNDAGLRRLDDPADFVRLETASALRRDIPVIPVLVRGVKMPRAEQLPDDLKDLAYRNGVELTHARWASDVQLLIKALEAVVGSPRRAGTAESPRSADHAADGASLVDRAPEKNADETPGSVLPAVHRSKSVAAWVGGLVVALALVGYGAYHYVQIDRETQQKAVADKVAADKVAADKAEADGRRDATEAAAAKTATDKAAADKAAAEKAALDKAEADRRHDAAEAAAAKAATDKTAADKAEADRHRNAAEAARKAAADKAAADKAAGERAARAAADKAAADQAAGERATQAAADKAAAGKVAAAKAAADQAAATYGIDSPQARAARGAAQRAEVAQALQTAGSKAHSVNLIGLDPPANSVLANKQSVKVSFSYATTEPGGVRILVTPFVGTSPAPNIATGAPVLLPSGNSTGQQTFTITSGNVKVDGINLRMIAQPQGQVLYNVLVPAQYEFRGGSEGLTPPQVRMKFCSERAQNLTGDQRNRFMHDCLSQKSE